MRTVLFWDFDGTLAEAPHIWSNTLYRLLLDTVPDCDVTLADIRRYTACIFPWDSPDKDHVAAKDAGWWRCMERRFFMMYQELGIGEEAARMASRGVRPCLTDPGNYRLYPDALDTLSRCRIMGYASYIHSNNFPDLEELAHALGISAYVDGFAVSACIGYEKPRPEIFEYAKKLAGEAERYVMIGDNPAADIDGGRTAGMRTILVHKDVPCRADRVCKTLAQIPEVLVSL